MAESTGSGRKALFRVVIAGSQEKIFKELTSTDRPLGAIFNARMRTTGETGSPPLLTRLIYKAMGAFESLLPRRTRSDRWPLETFGKEKR